MGNNYKKFLVTVLIIVILLHVLLFILGNFIILKCKLERVPYDVFMTHIWMKKKESIANQKSKNGRKIIFVSGSNTLFGIVTKDIEDAFGIPTVNFATHTGYIPIIFRNAEKVINENDIVIMPLELGFYEKKLQKNYISNNVAAYIIAYDKDMYKILNLSNKIYCVRYLYTKYLKERKRYAIDETSCYSINAWNENGDVVCQREFMEEKYKNITLAHLTLEDINSIGQKGSYINKFLDKMSERNVKVYFMAPNIIDSDNADDIVANLSKVFDKLGVKPLGKVEESVFPKTYFFDTRYHLNTQGSEYRTKQVIKYLKDIEL